MKAMETKHKSLIEMFPDVSRRERREPEMIDYGPDDEEGGKGFAYAVFTAFIGMAGVLIGMIIMGFINAMRG